MDNELTTLRQQVAELMQWKRDREKQQITFPLDPQSIEVLQKYFIQVLGRGMFTRASGVIGDYFWYVKNNDIQDRIGTYGALIPYTVNTSTDVFYAPNHGFPNGSQIQVLSESQNIGVITAPPNPLTDSTAYYIINSTTNTFKLSLTFGGSAINITDSGNGTNYFTVY